MKPELACLTRIIAQIAFTFAKQSGLFKPTNPSADENTTFRTGLECYGGRRLDSETQQLEKMCDFKNVILQKHTKIKLQRDITNTSPSDPTRMNVRRSASSHSQREITLFAAHYL